MTREGRHCVRSEPIWSSLTVRAPFAPSASACPKLPVVAPPRRGFSRLGGDPMPDTMIDPATIEARCRRLMAEHAATKARGWDSERTRADLHAEIDAWLDAYSEARVRA